MEEKITQHFDLEYLREHFDLKLIKKRSELMSIDACAKIAALIRDTSLTQDAFAKLVDIDPANLSRILTGKHCPSLKMYLRLVKGVSHIIELFDEFQKTKENESQNPV